MSLSLIIIAAISTKSGKHFCFETALVDKPRNKVMATAIYSNCSHLTIKRIIIYALKVFCLGGRVVHNAVHSKTNLVSCI